MAAFAPNPLLTRFNRVDLSGKVKVRRTNPTTHKKQTYQVAKKPTADAIFLAAENNAQQDAENADTKYTTWQGSANRALGALNDSLKTQSDKERMLSSSKFAGNGTGWSSGYGSAEADQQKLRADLDSATAANQATYDSQNSAALAQANAAINSAATTTAGAYAMALERYRARQK